MTDGTDRPGRESRFGASVDRAVKTLAGMPWADQRAAARRVTVLVCGSRDWADRESLASALTGLPGEHYEIEIIHGGARGADRIAGEEAERLGFGVRVFPANWRGLGKRAGILRNIEMLDEKPNLVMAFQRDGSRGTQHTIDEARRRGIPVQVYAEEGS